MAVRQVCVFLIISAAGCDTTATIYTKEGRAIEGWIRRNDASTVFIHPAEPPKESGDLAGGILEREIFDDCVTDRTTDCRKRCYRKYHISDEIKRCMKSCLDRPTAMKVCERLSVVLPVP